MVVLRKEIAMKIFAPSYYKTFKCIADKCRHSCCIGWDVYIDDETLEKYSAMDGALGERLRKSLKEKIKAGWGNCPGLRTESYIYVQHHKSPCAS